MKNLAQTPIVLWKKVQKKTKVGQQRLRKEEKREGFKPRLSEKGVAPARFLWDCHDRANYSASSRV